MQTAAAAAARRRLRQGLGLVVHRRRAAPQAAPYPEKTHAATHHGEHAARLPRRTGRARRTVARATVSTAATLEPNVLVAFKITDDSGFLAIVDPDAYQGFVDAAWTAETIQEHFRQQMRERHLLAWGTGMEHLWRIDVSLRPIKTAGFREVTGSIFASQGRLLLTNYESLTMAAQFPDITLPQAKERGQILSVSRGLYDCRIIQLSDPASHAPFEESVNFIYEFTRGTSPRAVWSELPWGVV